MRTFHLVFIFASLVTGDFYYSKGYKNKCISIALFAPKKVHLSLIKLSVFKFKFSRPFKVNIQVLTWIFQCWASVGIWWRWKPETNRNALFWKKNTLYYIVGKYDFLVWLKKLCKDHLKVSFWQKLVFRRSLRWYLR